MDSLQALDLAILRFVNLSLGNRVFDAVLPWFSSNVLFIPALFVLAVWLVWKGGVRGRLLVCFLLLTFALGDPVLVNSIKKWIGRPRPSIALTDLNLLVGRSNNPSMPSGHAANWFAASAVVFVYYRRSLWAMLPVAFIVCFSRVYVGAHYPSDVLAGVLIGVGYAALSLWACNAAWLLIGPRWFPIWWSTLPSLVRLAKDWQPWNPLPAISPPPSLSAIAPATLDRHWVRLGYLLIGIFLVGHLAYLASGKIELSEDEAYHWLWSKHLALSYYSKPPLIAWVHGLGAWIAGDTQFGVRFLSPIIAAVISLLVVRFLAREVNGFVACLSVLVTSATPMLMAGATLLTVDALLVLFWTAALVSGWQAVQRNSTAAWAWTGLWLGLGSLSHYTALFQWIGWAAFFLLCPAARAQWRRPGPCLALGINLLCFLPVLLWNAQNQWSTLEHLSKAGGLTGHWEFTTRYLREFVVAEAALLNPIFFVGMIWAAVVVWKNPPERLAIYLFSMGAPLFLFCLACTLRGRVQPNWVAPAVLPLFCLMLVYWDARWRDGEGKVKHWLMIGLTLGWLTVIPLHDTRLARKLFGRDLPVSFDPLRRVLRWSDLATTVNQARTDLLVEGKPVFLIGDHYGITSLLSFYIPEAKAGLPNDPLVYFLSSDQPENQFFYWPGYAARKGQNAIFIAQPSDLEGPLNRLRAEFESVTDLGPREILHNAGRVFHRIHLYACRNLR